jgi:hypothetical protein
MIVTALALTLPLAAHAQGRTRAASAPSAPPRAAAPAPTAGDAATPRTRATAPGRHRSGPPTRPASSVPGYSGWAGGVRDQWKRTPYGSSPYGSRPYHSRPYQSRPFGARHGGYALYPYVIVVPQPYPYAYDVSRDADVEAVPAPGVDAATGAAPLLVEPLAGSLLRLRWVGTDSTVHEVTLLIADAQRRPLVSQTVRERPYTAIFERTPRAAFIGVTVVHASGASTTTLVPMPAAAAGRDR